jgi:murein DD-endopeptidase MepM/ murein hydrolase activator NlpD
VRASAAGEVQFSGPTSSGYGNRVVIKHGTSGWKTKYAHLMDGSITVSDGQHVNQGQIIGKVGKSGG